ncbi:DNA repair protein RecN [Myxococcota bacterium]|nr:DNA repair protein RecN [Myxococcota bacterium]
MIETLRIQGLAIVERAELDFGPGLNVLTGETGAGKSIILEALGLLSGARASVNSLREGVESASVEALFRTDRLPELEAELVERGMELVDHELVVRRTVSRAGRSKAQLCGQLVPVSTLAETFGGRLEISSQHDSQRLRRPEVHGEMLDRLAGLQSLGRDVAEGVRAILALDQELLRLREASAERARRQDFLRFQVEEIDRAQLDVEQIEQMRVDRARLLHASRLGDEGGLALGLLVGDPERESGPSITDLLGETLRLVRGIAELDPSLSDLAQRIEANQADVRDAAFELERYVTAVEVDPARLSEIEERLHQVEQLHRKYGAEIEDVLRFRDEAEAELASAVGADQREGTIVGERSELARKVVGAAKKLTRGRSKAARSFSATVQTALRSLGMSEAEFSVALVPQSAPDDLPCGPGGHEAPEFFFNANAGETPQPLRKSASGGELSRTFLAIKNAARDADPGMVLVFDEVDAGVGGRAADRVGRTLAELASHHQVLCITHLPQVAAFAQTHFKVEKLARKGRTRVRVTRVEDADRVEEIARMAGGEKVGEATRRHARALLGARAG